MFVEDLSPFFNVDDFAVNAMLDWDPVVGLFDTAYMQAFDGVSGATTVFILPTDSALNATSESILVIDDARYRVRSVQPDGNGVTTLQLERQ